MTDAQILANKTDGALLIVNTGVVEKSSVVKAKNFLLVAQAKILGIREKIKISTVRLTSTS